MKRPPLRKSPVSARGWICLSLLVTLILIAAQRKSPVSAKSPCCPGARGVEAIAAESATPVPTPLATPEPTPTPRLSGRVLFIGDNSSSFLDKYLPILAASGTMSTTIESKVIVRVDAPLSMHWQVGKAAEEIGTANRHLVVLQEDLARSWDRVDEFHETVRQFYEEIKQTGAETMLYMTWQHKGHTTPTIEQIADVYSKTGAELGVKTAPVGLAFERATRERPALNLYLADGVKDNLRGFYLTMCVLYGTIFEHSPVA